MWLWQPIPAAGQQLYVAGAYTLTADTATMSLSAQAVGLTATRSLPSASASVSLSAQDVGIRAARLLASATQTLAISGQIIGLAYSGAPPSVTRPGGSAPGDRGTIGSTPRWSRPRFSRTAFRG